MNTNIDLQTVSKHGWSSGFANLWRKESWLWWRKRQWLWQSIIWLVLFNGIIAIMLLALSLQKPSASTSVESTINGVLAVFFNLQFSIVPLALILLLQGAMINERQSSTAAWILSKPVTHSAFILAKLASLPGLFLTMILLPDIVGYLEILFALHHAPSTSIYVLAFALLTSSMLLFFCLMLLAGTLFKNRILIISVPFVILIFSLRFLVQTLLIPHLLNNDGLFTLLSILAMLVCAAILLLLASKVFAQEEF